MTHSAPLLLTFASLSARRAWIEIATDVVAALLAFVALRKESVDRNNSLESKQIDPSVALRKESVDRNLPSMHCSSRTVVALRKESVDRNRDVLPV